MKHPDVTGYARELPLSPRDKAKIERHLKSCGECRDFVLFIRKFNAQLTQDGRTDRQNMTKLYEKTVKPKKLEVPEGFASEIKPTASRPGILHKRPPKLLD